MMALNSPTSVRLLRSCASYFVIGLKQFSDDQPHPIQQYSQPQRLHIHATPSTDWLNNPYTEMNPLNLHPTTVKTSPDPHPVRDLARMLQCPSQRSGFPTWNRYPHLNSTNQSTKQLTGTLHHLQFLEVSLTYCYCPFGERGRIVNQTDRFPTSRSSPQ